MLEAAGLCFGYPGRAAVFRDLDLTLRAGDVLCVLGPNGVGKSTLLRCLAGLEAPSAGRVLLDGLPPRPGRGTALVPQSDAPVFAFDVRTVVEMGRAPHLSWTATPGRSDRAAVDRSLDRLGLRPLAARLYPELSGGERQLVTVARALAQEPSLLLLDEPTSHLDFANAAGVLELVRGLAGEGLHVAMTTHDPDHAFLLADQVLVMAHGGIPPVAGPPGAVLTEQRLTVAYGRPVTIRRIGSRTVCWAETRLDRAPRP